jgi:beta-xylosidase
MVPAQLADAVDAAPSTTYTNPVSAGVVDTFPDPAVIRGKDGAWYAYGTQNPVFNSQGEAGERILPILRSEDLAHWEYAARYQAPGATTPAPGRLTSATSTGSTC